LTLVLCPFPNPRIVDSFTSMNIAAIFVSVHDLHLRSTHFVIGLSVPFSICHLLGNGQMMSLQ